MERLEGENSQLWMTWGKKSGGYLKNLGVEKMCVPSPAKPCQASRLDSVIKDATTIRSYKKIKRRRTAGGVGLGTRLGLGMRTLISPTISDGR